MEVQVGRADLESEVPSKGKATAILYTKEGESSYSPAVARREVCDVMEEEGQGAATMGWDPRDESRRAVATADQG